MGELPQHLVSGEVVRCGHIDGEHRLASRSGRAQQEGLPATPQIGIPDPGRPVHIVAMVVIRPGQLGQFPQQAGRDIGQLLDTISYPKAVQHAVIGTDIEHGRATGDCRRAEERLIALPLGLGQASRAAVAVIALAHIDGIRVDDVTEQIAAIAKYPAIALLATALTAQIGDPAFSQIVTGNIE